MSTVPASSSSAASSSVFPQIVSGAQRALNVAVVGYGTVGTAVVRILSNEKPQGLRLTHICNRAVRRKKSDSVPGRVIWTERFDDVLEDSVDVVVELIGGDEDARFLVGEALRRGKAVVTANKKLIANHGAELLTIASDSGAQLLYGASVAGGVPVLPGLNTGLSGDRIIALRGVVNGTCNFILSKVEAGGDFAAALKEAQHFGYAEAEPSDDIESYDAQSKLAILARTAFHADVDAAAIPRRGITTITPFDFACARELGCTIRQVARASLEGDAVRAAVTPALVPLSSPLARVTGSENVVIATGIYGGDMVFCGAGAGGNATAVAVVSDLLAIQNREVAPAQKPQRTLRVIAEKPAPHVVRCRIREGSNGVAGLVSVLSSRGIAVQSVNQHAREDRTALVAITTAAVAPELIERTANEISQLANVIDRVTTLPLIS